MRFLGALPAFPGVTQKLGEVLGARWEEVDLDARVWTIPSKRMKAGRPHRVPLCERACEILISATLDPSAATGFIFPGAKAGKPLSNMALLQLVKGLSPNGFVPHGFRSSFSGWARDRTGYARDIVEMSLAHAIKDKTEAAYRARAYYQQLAERRPSDQRLL